MTTEKHSLFNKQINKIMNMKDYIKSYTTYKKLQNLANSSSASEDDRKMRRQLLLLEMKIKEQQKKGEKSDVSKYYERICGITNEFELQNQKKKEKMKGLRQIRNKTPVPVEHHREPSETVTNSMQRNVSEKCLGIKQNSLIFQKSQNIKEWNEKVRKEISARYDSQIENNRKRFQQIGEEITQLSTYRSRAGSFVVPAKSQFPQDLCQMTPLFQSAYIPAARKHSPLQKKTILVPVQEE